MTSPASSEPVAPTLAILSPLITALVTALAAWKLFEPKFARVRTIRTEMGELEIALWWLYVLPQRVLSIFLWLIAAYLFLSFMLSFQADWFVGQTLVQSIVRPENTIWVIFSSGAVAAAIYWNLATYLLLWLTALLSYLPIPGLRGRFGPRGSSPGWHQARALCEGPDKGNPLLIDYRELDRVGWLVVAKMAREGDERDLAEAPADLGISERANIALFGGLLEAEHYANGWPQPPWSKFYAALADVQRSKGRARNMFTPSVLVGFESGMQFFEYLRTMLDTALEKRGQKRQPEQYLAAAETVTTTWARLKQEAEGDVLKLVPGPAKKVKLDLLFLNWRLRTYPRLESDGMRAQVLKLFLRWGTLPGVRRRKFGQPFAKRLAWLLLEENALRTLPDVKHVTFHGTAEVALIRIALGELVKRVSDLIRRAETKEARAAQAKLDLGEWGRREAIDFTLWQWSGVRYKELRGKSWEKARWKFEDGRVSRAG